MSRQHWQVSRDSQSATMDISETDWDTCVLYQKDSTKTLICPDKQLGTGYSYVGDYSVGFEGTTVP